MHHRFSFARGRIARALALLAMSCALAAPAASASTGTPKKTVTTASAKKKQQAKIPANKTTPRKAVAQKKPAVKKTTAATKNTARRTATAAAAVAASATAVAVARPSYAQLAGLHKVPDPLALKSSVALVVDQDTKEVLLSKNDHAVLPIASITKLMTGLLIAESGLPMGEVLTITQDDVDTEKHSGSRLHVGTRLTRGEMLHLALMSSENRAAHALGRTYPGGLDQFVQLMNAKAKMLGMTESQFVEPTGLSSRNQASAHDLATLVNVAHANPLMRELSTSHGHTVAVGRRTLQFNNTNSLVKSERWDIGLQKTGYIAEAGRCLVMQAEVSGRKLIMVFLDSVGKNSRLGDAERVRRWVQSLDGGSKVVAASH